MMGRPPDGRPGAREWARRLQALVGCPARLSDASTAPHVWTGLEAVDVQVRDTWTVTAIDAVEGDLVVRGRDERGQDRDVRIPVTSAYLGLDGRGDFFLAGWPEGAGRYAYLRISRDTADGSGRTISGPR